MVFFKIKKKLLEDKLKKTLRKTSKIKKSILKKESELDELNKIKLMIKKAKKLDLTKNQKKLLKKRFDTKQKRKVAVKKILKDVNKKFKDSNIKFTPTALFDEKMVKKRTKKKSKSSKMVRSRKRMKKK